MPRKSYKPEEIVAKLRQVDVLSSQGQSVAEAIRSIGVSEVTYCMIVRLQILEPYAV
jgi:putative transposase